MSAAVPTPPGAGEDVRRLVVVHEHANATDETVAALALVGALVDRAEVRPEVVLLRGGDLAADFGALAPTTVVDGLAKWSVAGLAERLRFAAGRRDAGLRRRSRRLGLDTWRDGDAVYLHSVLGVQALRYLPAGRPTVLCRLTEEAHPLDHPLRAEDLALLLRRVDGFLAETIVGGEELVDDHDVTPERVVRVPELLVTDHPRLADRAQLRAARRQELGISRDAVVVGSFGASLVDPPDVAAPVWSSLLRRGIDGHPVLLWARTRIPAGFWMEHDLDAAHLASSTRGVDPTDLRSVLAACDVALLLTRRVDYPRAYLELVAAGVPVLCFEGNRLADAVRRTAPANVLPYLNLDAVVDRLAALIGAPPDPALGDGLSLTEIEAAHGPAAFAGALLAATAGTGGTT